MHISAVTIHYSILAEYQSVFVVLSNNSGENWDVTVQQASTDSFPIHQCKLLEPG
jgi:hypothetical protein